MKNRFIGDYYNIGLQQGQIYKQNGMNTGSILIDSNLYKKQLDIYKKFYPEFLEELRGAAQSGGFNVDTYIYGAITGELRFYKKRIRNNACTIFGLKNEKGLFVGRNYDWFPVARQFFQSYVMLPTNRYGYIGISDMGIVENSKSEIKNRHYIPEDAINNQGLYIGLTFATANKWSYGISSLSMIRLIAETCKDVSEALKVFKKVPICCPKNFFIADSKGNMVVVEHVSKTYQIISPQKDILIKTNHFISPKLLQEDRVLDISPASNTYLRYYEVLQLLNTKRSKLRLPDIKNVLRSPGSHVFEKEKDNNTIWTLGMNMSDKRYLLYSEFKDTNPISLKI